MNRWRLSKYWMFVWGITLLMGGLIFYHGYQSSLSGITVEGQQEKINESAYAVIEHTSHKMKERVGKELDVIRTEERLNNFKQDRQFQKDLQLVFGQIYSVAKPLELKNFPSPIDGRPIRNVGNYYSENLGNYIFHAGVDYALSEGTVIRATRGGKVVLAGPDAILGQKVTLDCGEGWEVTYGGLDNLRVQEGEVVETQGAIGQVGLFPGTEGESEQSQLHYEVWHDNQVQLNNNTVFTK